MSDLSRKTAVVFGTSAGFHEISEFGSLAASAPAYSTDPATIQSLSQWVDGWFSAVLGDNSPAIEDMNAFCFVIAYQIAYILQKGVGVWDSGTTYYHYGMVKQNGKLFISLVDSNLNNPIADKTKWQEYGGAVRSVSGTDTCTIYDETLACDPTGGSFTETLPNGSATPIGCTLTFKNIATNGNTVTLSGDANIDGSATLILNSIPVMDSVTIRWSGTIWMII